MNKFRGASIPGIELNKPIDWGEFYRKRVNTSYQQFFELKYAPFLLYIKSQMKNEAYINDAGCGIGSVSKYLRRHIDDETQRLIIIDNNLGMLELAKENLKSDIFIPPLVEAANLLDYNYEFPQLHITHGVLEHFTNTEIKGILKRLPNSIHYVPLDKYKIPSAGDERLLPAEYWIDTFKPSYSFTFNNGYDLCIKA